MSKNLNIEQAKQLREYLLNSAGNNRISNIEVLAGLILFFSRTYLDQIIQEMEKK